MRQLLREPSYNIHPGQKIVTVVQLDNGSFKGVNLFWGLVPSWAKDCKNSGNLINARAETIREKPSFRAAFHHRRCLIPATGFYEWARRDGKRAYNFHREDGGLFAFAGVWEQWQHESETLYSCAIITTAAEDLMRPIHDRMPVIIPSNQYSDWLDKGATVDDAYRLLTNNAYQALKATPVSNWVNNPAHNDPSCLDSVELGR